MKADGTVIDCLRAMKKDNTGYHLKHLFIGSEGTLGVVTKVAIHCPVLPKAVTLGFFGKLFYHDNNETVKNLYAMYRNRSVFSYTYTSSSGVKSFEHILQLYKSAKSSLGEILSAFEMADSDSIQSTVRNLKLP